MQEMINKGGGRSLKQECEVKTLWGFYYSFITALLMHFNAIFLSLYFVFEDCFIIMLNYFFIMFKLFFM